MADARPLLVALDDDEEIVGIVAAVARQAGYEVSAVTSASAFNAIISTRVPEVVVLDLQMPEMDGVEMLRHLAEIGSTADIVLVSGMDERTISAAEQYAAIRGLVVRGALQKPFVPDELHALLRTVWDARRPLGGDDLRRAIANGELTVYYQPTVKRFADGTWDIATMEALLRWNHPTRGLLVPNDFIAIGEEQGLMRAMTDFVLERGIEQLKAWHVQRLDVGLRVNVAATLIADLRFPDRLQTILAQHDVDPSALTIEITETAMLDDAPETMDILTRLRLKEINLAIDDFGIGYSSLTQLFRMPFNEMKIDKSLTSRVPQSKEARIMIEALIDLAHKLNLSVCAEGVETEDALAFLGRVGCDSAQGYHIGRPIAAREVPGLIRRWDRRVRPEAAEG